MISNAANLFSLVHNDSRALNQSNYILSGYSTVSVFQVFDGVTSLVNMHTFTFLTILAVILLMEVEGQQNCEGWKIPYGGCSEVCSGH